MLHINIIMGFLMGIGVFVLGGVNLTQNCVKVAYTQLRKICNN